jgi:hypothetical protein
MLIDTTDMGGGVGGGGGVALPPPQPVAVSVSSSITTMAKTQNLHKFSMNRDPFLGELLC